MSINWGGSVDQLMASWQKPIGTYASVITLCYCAIFIRDTDTLVIPGLLALAGFNGGMRTIEKISAINAAKTQPTATPDNPLPTKDSSSPATTTKAAG